MTPKLSKAVAAVEKLPQARQDALADLLLEAAARAPIDDATAIAELRTLLATAEASGVGDRSMTDLIEAARDEARRSGLLGDEQLQAHADAERDVLDIYLYTLEHFGPAQADKYASDLFARFSGIVAQPCLGRDFGDIYPGARRANQGSHAIYYRPDGDGILILRILHQRMDPARHLGREQ